MLITASLAEFKKEMKASLFHLFFIPSVWEKKAFKDNFNATEMARLQKYQVAQVIASILSEAGFCRIYKV